MTIRLKLEKKSHGLTLEKLYLGIKQISPGGKLKQLCRKEVFISRYNGVEMSQAYYVYVHFSVNGQQ